MLLVCLRAVCRSNQLSHTTRTPRTEAEERWLNTDAWKVEEILPSLREPVDIPGMVRVMCVACAVGKGGRERTTGAIALLIF